jgi:hypothetical protein
MLLPPAYQSTAQARIGQAHWHQAGGRAERRRRSTVRRGSESTASFPTTERPETSPTVPRRKGDPACSSALGERGCLVM